MYLLKVLHLVHYLVKYGYYGDLADIIKLLGPLLSLLDGRNDKPYPKMEGIPTNLCLKNGFFYCINLQRVKTFTSVPLIIMVSKVP